MTRLGGRVALVTGAARGIGRAVAARLVEEGASVVLTDIHTDEIDALAEELSGPDRNVRAMRLDVSNPHDCVAASAAVERELGPISALVNNAGVIFQGKIHDDGADETWRRTIAINLGGPFNMCRAFYPHLLATKGAVVNMASIRSFTAAGNAAAYAASKGGVLQLTKALAVEWAERGIRVNGVAPGFVESSLVPEAEKTAQREAMIVARTPLRRQGVAEEVAGAVAYLLSDEASFVTGAVLPVDGGYLAS